MDPKDQDIIDLIEANDKSSIIKDISYLLEVLIPYHHIKIIRYLLEYYRIISLSKLSIIAFYIL